MSKVAFRARNLDANRALPVLRDHELPPEFMENGTSAPRITQQEITTGMEKEEEMEHHLQQALTAQQVHKSAEQQAIPIPEITETDEEQHRFVYRRPFKMPKSLINSQAYMFDNELPAYDADDEDLAWLAESGHCDRLDVITYERMVQCLEEGSSTQRLVTPEEAQLLLKSCAEQSVVAAVYEHWHVKRSHCDSLVPIVLTEKRDGSNNNNPYVAFRRRKEKMQTRKNRKNDELSYERMLKVRLDLCKASLLFELLKRREEAKRELFMLAGSMFERRYAAGDWTGAILREGEIVARHQTVPEPLTTSAYSEFTAVVRCPSVCAALKAHADRHGPKRRAEEALRRISRRSALLPVELEPDRESVLQKRRRLSKPTVPTAAPLLPQSERHTLLDSHKPRVAEDAQTAASIDREFAFRRKAGCRYAAPGVRNADRCRYLLCLGARGRSRLYFTRARVSRSRRAVLDLVDPLCTLPELPSSSVQNAVNLHTRTGWPELLSAVQSRCVYCNSQTRCCSVAQCLCAIHQSHIDDQLALHRLHATNTRLFTRSQPELQVEPAMDVSFNAPLLQLVELYLQDSHQRPDDLCLQASRGENCKANGFQTSRCAPRVNGVNINGENNNEGGRLAQPTRLAAIGKRLTDSLGGLLGGIAPISPGTPLAPLTPSVDSRPADCRRNESEEALSPEQVHSHTPIST